MTWVIECDNQILILRKLIDDFIQSNEILITYAAVVIFLITF